MKINTHSFAESLENYYSPKVISEVNGQFVKIAKINGDKIPWHNHENEDELFYVLKGTLKMEIEGQKAFPMNSGDLFVVPKGVNHRVDSTEECSILLIESKTTKHTGDVKTDITKTIEEQLQ